jgi:hypothetical protein
LVSTLDSFCLENDLLSATESSYAFRGEGKVTNLKKKKKKPKTIILDILLHFFFLFPGDPG